MGCSGVGVCAVVTTFIAAALTIISLLTPLWVHNNTIDSSHETMVTKAETGFGLWLLCVDVEFDGTKVLMKDHDKAVDYDTKACYPYYYSGLERNIISYSGQLGSNKTKDSVCKYFDEDSAIAARSFALMTGMVEKSVDSYLTRVCSKSGKAAFGLMLGAGVTLALAFFILLFNVCCCSGRSCFVGFARFLTIFSTIFSAVLSFFVFSQLRSLKAKGDATYHVSFYLEITGFLITLMATCAIESYALKQRTPKSDRL